jgi:hypothetical protein
MNPDTGIRVQESGFRNQGSGIRVQESGLIETSLISEGWEVLP